MRGVPLPLAAATGNRRSLVALDNLVSLIATCTQHPRAAGQVFLAGDGEDVSTAELLRRIAQVQEQSARLLWCPVGVVEFAARLLGKGDVAQRLLRSLRLDISKNRNLLGWQPSSNLDEGLRRAVQGALMLRALDIIFVDGLGAGLSGAAGDYLVGLFDTGAPLFARARGALPKAVYLGQVPHLRAWARHLSPAI